MSLESFLKNAPVGFVLQHEPFRHDYRYFLRGKGCTLGILFQDSTHIYFEWLTENDRPVAYAPELRYKAWRRAEFTRLVSMGVWDPSCAAQLAA